MEWGISMKIIIGEKIKDLRKNHDITQNALASYLGVSNQTISKWENEISMPDICLIPSIANYFGITIDELFGYVPEKNNEAQAEMYFQAIFHFSEMASEAYKHKNREVLLKYVDENEINPLIRESIPRMCDGMEAVHLTLLMENKAYNEYMYTDENFVKCIIKGIELLCDGCQPFMIRSILISFLPKNIYKTVMGKIEASGINFKKLEDAD